MRTEAAINSGPGSRRRAAGWSARSRGLGAGVEAVGAAASAEEGVIEQRILRHETGRFLEGPIVEPVLIFAAANRPHHAAAFASIVWPREVPESAFPAE